MVRYPIFGTINTMRFFFIVCVVAVLAGPAHAYDLSGPAQVHDGDTIRIGDQNIRLWGIDAVELKQLCGDVPCGIEARETLKVIIGGRDVTCTAKGESYKRIVAQCYAGNDDVAALMARAGMAFDYAHYSRGFYQEDERAARAAHAGLWAMNGVENPAVWRQCHLRHKCPMTKQDFLSGFRPLTGRLAPFEAAYRLAYQPHVAARGIEVINTAVDAMPYVADARKGQILDPDIFWTKGGDCDKHALIKMLELRAQGITDTYYVVLVNGPKHDAHAVLAVEQNGIMLALDNHFKKPVPISRVYKDYKPAYFIDAQNGRVWQARGYHAG